MQHVPIKLDITIPIKEEHVDVKVIFDQRKPNILAKRAGCDIRLLGLNPGSCTGLLWASQSASHQYKEDDHSTCV